MITITTHPFNGPLSGTTRVSRYQKSKTNLDFTDARNSKWQWNPLGHMQVCTSLQPDNHASTPPLSFLQASTAKCAIPHEECRWGAHLPSLGREPVVGQTRKVSDTRSVRRQTYGYLPSRRALPPFDRYQIILLMCAQG